MTTQRRVWRSPLACAILLPIVGACTTTRTWEISTGGARNFQWTGKIRVIETTKTSWFQAEMAHSVALVGDDGRNVVIHLRGDVCDQHPVARLENAQSVGDTVERVLAMALVSSTTNLKGVIRRPQVAVGVPTSSNEAPQDYERVVENAKRLQEGDYAQMTASEAIVAADHATYSRCTTFDIGKGKSLKAWVEPTMPPTIHAQLLGRDSHVLHDFGPVGLPFKEIPARSR